MTSSRRQFLHSLGAAGVVASRGPHAQGAAVAPGLPPQPSLPSGSDIGSLYPFVQTQADRSPLELSFLRDEFTDLAAWQSRARAMVLDHLFYHPAPAPPAAQIVRREDRGDYVQEYLTF